MDRPLEDVISERQVIGSSLATLVALRPNLLKLIYRVCREEITVEDEAAVRIIGHATMQERYGSSQHFSPMLHYHEAEIYVMELTSFPN